MRSSSRNSRKPYRAACLAAAASLLLGSAVQAADDSHSFVLTAYSNAQGGTALVSGDYATAIKQLGSSATLSTLDPSPLSNNRCVAFALTKQWESARAACDQAVRDARLEKTTLPSYQSWARKLANDYLAVALSNRAVLHWLSSDSAAAATDLKKAEGLAPKAAFVARNLSALQYSNSSNSTAQVTVAPQG
jgi:hypothetical protein